MAEGIGVAATGGSDATGMRWAKYSAGEWSVLACERRDRFWYVFIRKTAGGGFRLIEESPMSEQVACWLAEAVAVAVAHVLQQAAGPAVEEA